MNKNIDYTLEEILENQEGGFLSGISKTTIKKCIARLEKQYFENFNVFRNNNKTSDYLFRFEIKDLLILLIKLENDNPFSDGKSLKEGISEKSIEKIINVYRLFEDNYNLENYEQKLLHSKYDVNESLKTIKEIKIFQDNFTKFFMVVVENYTSFTSDFFQEIIRQIEAWSYQIISYSENKNVLSQVASNNYKLCNDMIYNANKSFTLDLKIAVVNTIIELSTTMYDFDKDGKCSRKPFTTDILFKLNHVDIDTIGYFRKKYHDLFEINTKEKIDKYYYSSSISKNDKDDGSEQGIIEEKRRYILDFLNEYYFLMFSYENNTEKIADEIKDEKTLDAEEILNEKIQGKLKKIYSRVYLYIKNAYVVNSIFSQINNADIYKYIAEYGMKEVLLSYNSTRRYFIEGNFKIDAFEQSFWEIIKSRKFKCVEDVILEKDIIQLLDWHICAYLSEDYDISLSIIKKVNESKNVENFNTCIQENVRKLNKDFGKIMENMLAMILKLEDEKFRNIRHQ